MTSERSELDDGSHITASLLANLFNETLIVLIVDLDKKGDIASRFHWVYGLVLGTLSSQPLGRHSSASSNPHRDTNNDGRRRQARICLSIDQRYRINHED